MRAMTYGPSCTGVSDSMLDAQKRAAAAIAAPGAGTGGQNPDIALLLADGGLSGKADPAYDAHLIPLGEWAHAVWEGWMPVKAMRRMIEHVKEQLQHAKSPWSKVYGPAATIVMTCRRLRWTVLSATHFVTDNGILLNLALDPLPSFSSCVRPRCSGGGGVG